MAHAKLNLQRMYEWIEARVGVSDPTPTDAEIMQHFGFDNPESARTLLAELADAGRITIKGYGPDRVITLGRTASTLAATPRPTPTVRKPDPVVEAGLAKIAAIVGRGAGAGAARAVKAAEALTAVRAKPSPSPRTSKAPAPHPVAVATVKETVPMPAKTICLPATETLAIAAVEARAKELSSTIGIAAADLIVAGAQTIDVERGPTERAAPTIDTILADLNTLFEDLARRADRPDQSEALAAAVARAEVAERKLGALREALAA